MFEGQIMRSTDVWGLGCLMYEMGSGLPLYYGIRHGTRERRRAAVSTVQPLRCLLIMLIHI